MAHENLHIDESVIAKYLAKESSNVEILQVEAWLNESEENQKTLADYRKIWEGAKPPAAAVKVDVDAAWAKLSHKIDASQKAQEPIVRSINPNRKWYAAAAVIIALVGLFGLYKLGAPKQVLLASTNEPIEQSLPDGSLVALNKGSELIYPDKFKGKTRQVELKGEAFFDVEPDKEKPFVITTQSALVKVLGTSFNVIAKEGQNVRVQVETGLVELSNPNADTNVIKIPAGATGILEISTGRVYLEHSSFADDLFWMNKKLKFKKTPLPEVLKVLEKNYKVRFDSDLRELESCLLTARFEEESIENILQVIAVTFNLQFEIEGDTVQFIADENNCGEI